MKLPSAKALSSIVRDRVSKLQQLAKDKGGDKLAGVAGLGGAGKVCCPYTMMITEQLSHTLCA